MKKSKIILITLAVVFITLGLTSYFVILPSVKALTAQANKAAQAASKVKFAFQIQDINKVKEESLNLKKEVLATKKELTRLGFVKYIPFASGYYSDGEHLLSAAEHGTQLAILVSDSLIPFADALGLKGGGAGNAGSYAEKAIQSMPKILPNVDEIEAELKLVRKDIDKVNPNHYPSNLVVKGFKVRDSLAQAKAQIDSLEELTPQLRPILINLPEALGEPDPKTYLVLFQNDKEIRPTGGFITAYAIAKIHKGRLISTFSEDIYHLDARLNSREPSPAAIKQYLELDYFFIRDSNLSPDFVESMRVFADKYRRAPGSEKIDGIVALDTEFVRSLLEVTGPITSAQYGETFSAEKNKEGISDVVYKLENYSENLLRKTENRKALIGDLMNALINKILSSSKEKWQPLLTTVKEMVDEKHLLLLSYDEGAQGLLDKYNYSGRIKDFDGDYFHLNSANLGGKKANLYVKESVMQDIVVEKDGTVTKTVNLEVKNTGPADGWLNDTYKSWIRIYVPKGSQLIEGNGFSVGEELNKTRFTTFIYVNPRSSKQYTLKYKLPFKVTKEEDLKMLIQKQPGIGNQELNFKVNGKKVETLNLITDKELKLKL